MRKHRFQSLTAFLFLVFVSALSFLIHAGKTCAADPDHAEKEFFAMDTIMTVSVNGNHAERAAEAAEEEVYRLDSLLSTGRETSEISRINAEGEGVLSEDGAAILEKALKLYEASGGLFDVSIYPVMELWGFAGGSTHVPQEKELKEALSHVDASRIEFDPEKGTVHFADKDMKIDLGGIAKGYTSARLIQLFQDQGIESALVSLGGNVQALGTKPDGSFWRVGVQDPENPDRLLGVLSIADQAVITSGGYERYFQEDGKTWHHIIDPRTGYPAESGLTSVTIVSTDGTLADGLSTFLFIAGEEEAVRFWRLHAGEFEMILALEDGTILVSEGLDDCFQSDYDYSVIEKAG